jgi:membrane protein DedA with SNARE-associated domain
MQNLLTSTGYAALILFGFLEAACIPFPSEITFGFAGVLAYQGRLNLALVIVIGSLAELAGSYASYAVGRAGGRPLVHRLGRYVLVTESDVDRAERFLEGRGAWAIPVGRVLPFIRGFTSIVAGLVRVPAIRFGILSLIGTVLYAVALSSIGYALGSAWQNVNHGLTIVGYILRDRRRGHRRLRVLPRASVPARNRAGPASASRCGRIASGVPVRCRGLKARKRPGRSARVRSRAPARPG